MSWEKRTLGDLCQIEKGKIGIQKATPGEFPLVVTAEERLSHNEYHFEGNAVVIPLVSSTGHGHRSLKRIHFQSGKFAVGNILCAVIPNDENILRADYLYRFLDLNREKELVGRMRGMANVTLPMKEIAQIEIPVPPIDAQIEFVQQFSNLEEKNNELRGELTHQLDLVKQLRQSFLREAMQGKLVLQYENDEPASVLLEKIKAEKERLVKEGKIKKQKPLPPITEDEIPFEIPENWVWCRGNTIAEYIDPQPSHRTPSESKDGVPYIAMKDINGDGSVNFLSARKVGLKILEEHRNRYQLRNGDFIFGKIGTIGKPVKLPEPFNYTLSANVILIQAENLLISSEFLFYFLSSPAADRILFEKKSTMSYPVFGMAKARMMTIPLPPLSEQHSIVAKLDELMHHCDELEASIKESQQQNEMLLQQVLREALEPEEKEVVG
jgi:type I restriction enzyme S subunit